MATRRRVDRRPAHYRGVRGAPVALNTARRLKGMTQEALAEQAGVDQTTISDLEIGRNTNPSWETVLRIARALDVEPTEIFPIPDFDKKQVAS